MTTMSMTVPFAYSAWVRTAKKDVVKRSYVETHNFELPANDGVATAFWWMRREGERGEVKIVSGQPTMLVLGGIGTDDFLFPGHLVNVLSRRVGSVSHGLVVKQKGPPRPETVDVSYRDDAFDSLLRECSRLSLVNGRLHRIARPPMLMAQDGCVRVVEEILADEHQHAFRLDEIEFAVQRAAILGNVSTSAVERPTMELSSTDWLDDEVFDLSGRSGLHAFAKAVGKVLHRLPIDAMEAFCDLRDARAANPYDRAVCMEVAERLLAEIGHRHLPSQGLAVARHMIEVDAARSVNEPAPPVPR